MTAETQARILQAQTVRGVPPNAYALPFPSLGSALLHQAETQGLAPFLIYYDEKDMRSECSYGEFTQKTLVMAAFMRSLGVQEGSRIATAAHNHPDTILHYFAAWMLGACVVPLNMSEDDARLQYILTHSAATHVFCRSEYLSRVQAMLPRSVHLVEEAAWCNVLANEGGMEKIPQTAQYSLLDALIVYTSGTTGNPKGVVLTQANILADSGAIARFHGIQPATRLMCVLPVHHVNGTIVTHTTPVVAGASVVLNRKFQTEHFFSRIQREKVHIVSVVPTLLAFLLEAKAATFGVEKEHFRYFICGAGPLTCELARNVEQFFGIRILHGYGLSETTCYSCYLPTDLSHEAHKHWMYDYGFPSIGIPLEVNEMAIHDASGTALPAMERGEIVIRGANVMREYFQNEQANASTFEFGWFRSGDEGFYQTDAEGRQFFFITGRLKELIIRGGVNLAPLEIDEVLASAPFVKAGICVGFENDFYGEEVGALVMVQQEALNNIETAKHEILRYCQEKLPFSKAPKVVVLAEELPVTSTGKYQRNKVKHLFAAWKAVQFRK